MNKDPKITWHDNKAKDKYGNVVEVAVARCNCGSKAFELFSMVNGKGETHMHLICSGCGASYCEDPQHQREAEERASQEVPFKCRS